MPRRTDIKKILIIGSGPIAIGQACEFDYSGTQGCKALREEGYQIVLVNSNPATIMTDPEYADRTYIEPLSVETLERVIEKERPDALLPTLGGQTALNLGVALFEKGILTRYGVQMIGANAEVIHRAEDRDQFKQTCLKNGIDLPRSAVVHTKEEARAARDEIGLPCVIRAAFTLSGLGSGIAWNRDEFDRAVEYGLDHSPIKEVLIEESVLGWKEFEMEVMRDHADNVVIVCSIENFDPMGVHTGDSITVAPAQTLTDKEYQRMRDASLRIIRAIGVETGGSNIQFAIDPQSGRMVAIEMNPRVSRSSALASKATGFPIAKIAAKLAVGYTLDELKNDITRETPACFEPTIDYVVTKIPRFTFEKFRDANPTLGTQMKSIGEVMAIGRTFKESLQKAVRGMETGHFGLGLGRNDDWYEEKKRPGREEILAKLVTPNAERLYHIRYALLSGMTVDEIHERTKIDPWFLDHIAELVELERKLTSYPRLAEVPAEVLRQAKEWGYSDRQISYIWRGEEMPFREHRTRLGIKPGFRLVDTCAGEFEAYTPYYYSSHDSDADEVTLSGKTPRIMILGGGPNRIGQGIEFDYCCCQAAIAVREEGGESIMVNSNPETVSTDYDTSDRLFFEPLTVENVLNIHERMKPDGVIVQFGGQTPLNLAKSLHAAGVNIIGTGVDSIDRAEDRDKFRDLINRLGLKQPPSGIAKSIPEAATIATRIGYPVLVRPSFVLGGRGMEIVYDDASLVQFVQLAMEAVPNQPILVDRFLEDATEVDVDALCDGRRVVIAGVMEHIEEAGIHSGDSACAIPPFSLKPEVEAEIRRQAIELARELKVIGLMNIQFAVKADEVYVLEVNPRASRTVPFVSKATGLPIARIAAKLMMGRTLDELGLFDDPRPTHVSVKESTFPFNRFPGVDIILGPEMRSTGEVMGIDVDFPRAFAKAQLAAYTSLPKSGRIFISLADKDKPRLGDLGRTLTGMGFELVATSGSARVLREAGVAVTQIQKVQFGRPNIIDLMKNDEIKLIINTPSGRGARSDEGKIRAEAVMRRVPCITTISGAEAAIAAIQALRRGPLGVAALQDWHPKG
jgi:carbamoyl-phosphate synthase large subunit